MTAQMLRAARAIVVAAGAFTATLGAAQTPPPVAVFGQLPAITQLQLSPDGKHLATIQSIAGHLTPLILETDALRNGHPVVLPTADWTIDSFVWANNTRLIMVVKKNFRAQGDVQVRPWLRAIALNVDGTNPVVLLNKQRGYNSNVFAADIVSVDVDDPDHAYAALLVPEISSLPSKLSLGHFDKVTYRLDLLKVNLNNGEAESVENGNGETTMWLMDGHGHVVVRVDQQTHPLVDHVMVKRGGKWTKIASYDAAGGQGVNIVGLSLDGSSLIRLEAINGTGTKGLTQISIADGKSSLLFDDPNHDINQLLTEPWTGRIMGASTIDDQERYRYFDPKMQVLQEGLEAAFPGASVHAVSLDVARDKLIVQVNGRRQPQAFYLLDRITHKADELGVTYPELADKDLGENKPYPYKARDGLDIHAYLTLPPGKQARNLPAIVVPHGGPAEREQLQFEWLAQFLASRGYAVLQPNFRGSSGYGGKFEEAGYGEWGLKMQDDITDGVRKLIADGIADPKRICIFGASYGGYAALAGAAFTPDLYACAASWAAVTDLKKHLAARAEDYGRDSAVFSSWSRFLIGHDEDSERLDATSPAYNAYRIKCPILLLHGTADSTVRVDQSEVMDSALRSAGKNVEFIKFEGETHFMEAAATRIRVLTELEKFLAANIGN